jgi:hypothetical protein
MSTLTGTKRKTSTFFILLIFLLAAYTPLTYAKSSDPLPSWNNSTAKAAIINFVKETTQKGVVSQIFRRLQPAPICEQNYPANAINCL